MLQYKHDLLHIVPKLAPILGGPITHSVEPPFTPNKR